MPFSLRLDPDTESRIRYLTRTTGRSKADVVREAIAQYDPAGGPGVEQESAFDRLHAFIGVVATGGADLSVDTHAHYRTRLRAARRGRRSR
jgi:hypothetical protein